MPALDLTKVRSSFPSLSSGFIFASNAGGSQVAKIVADRVADCLLNANIRTGAGYATSIEITRRSLADAPKEAAKLFNAGSPEEIVFGASSTLNLENLARGLDADINERDEFVIMWEHEANSGCWKKLATRRGAVLKYWKPKPTSAENPYSLAYDIADLLPLISPRTRIVAFTACSNVLGSIIPVKAVATAVRAQAKAEGAPKIELCVDCVAYVSHRSIDVQDWDIDYAVFSFYKIYGPHISAMYTRASCLTSSISSIVYDHLTPKLQSSSSKLQPGGPGYELLCGATGTVEYLLSLSPKRSLKDTFDAIAAHEETLLAPLLEFLTAPEQKERGVRIVGEEKMSTERVPTVSFVVVGQNPLKSKDIVDAFNRRGEVGIGQGYFNSYSLVNNLSPKVDIDDGVVRISLVHYNTVEEVERIIVNLREVLLL